MGKRYTFNDIKKIYQDANDLLRSGHLSPGMEKLIREQVKKGLYYMLPANMARAKKTGNASVLFEIKYKFDGSPTRTITPTGKEYIAGKNKPSYQELYDKILKPGCRKRNIQPRNPELTRNQIESIVKKAKKKLNISDKKEKQTEFVFSAEDSKTLEQLNDLQKMLKRKTAEVKKIKLNKGIKEAIFKRKKGGNFEIYADDLAFFSSKGGNYDKMRNDFIKSMRKGMNQVIANNQIITDPKGKMSIWADEKTSMLGFVSKNVYVKVEYNKTQAQKKKEKEAIKRAKQAVDFIKDEIKAQFIRNCESLPHRPSGTSGGYSFKRTGDMLKGLHIEVAKDILK